MKMVRNIIFFLLAIMSGYAFAQNSNGYWGPAYEDAYLQQFYPTLPQAVTSSLKALNASLHSQGYTSTCYLSNVIPTNPGNPRDPYYGTPLQFGTVAAWYGNCYDPNGTLVSSAGSVVIASGHVTNPAKNNGSGVGCKCDGGIGSAGAGAGTGAGGNGTTSGVTNKNPLLAGDPINAATGNKYLQEDDYADSNWLTLRRFYNSSATLVPAEMGFQWRHSFDRSLQISPGGTIIALRPDGGEEGFGLANGVWTTDADVADTLTEIDNPQGVATGYTLFVAALREVETYDVNGLLQSVADQSTGQGISLTYSNSSTPITVAPYANLLLTVTDPKGRTLLFNYTSAGYVSQVTLPDNGVLKYTYDVNGNLETVQYPDSATRQYVYNEPSLTGGANLPSIMTGIVDEANVRYESTTYNASGQATSSSFAGNVGTTQITYNSNGTSTVQSPLGTSITMGYSTATSGLIQVASVNQPCGNECDQRWQSRSYDTNGYPKSYTDFRGYITATSYDSQGLLTQQIDAQGQPTQRTISTTWDTTRRIPTQRTVSDVNGNVVTSTGWVYNTRGQPLAKCKIDPTLASGYACSNTGPPPAGVRRWTYTYCDAVDTIHCPIIGLPLTVNGPRTDLTQTTSYTYYMTSGATSCGTPGAACHQAGDLYRIKDALGRTTTYNSYDGAGRVTRITDDANSVNTDMTYTPRGWLATRTVGGAVTTFGYDVMGDVKSIKDPSGIITTFTYDTAHRLTDITDAQGNDLHYTLDAAGNKTGEQTRTASGTVVHSLSRTFNTLGQLTALVDGLNKTVLNAGYSDSYDANGNLTHTADGLGIQRELSFDALNRLNTTVDNYNGTDTATANTDTVVAQDALDRVVGVADPNNLNTISTYDGLSNQTKLQSPDSGTSTDTFDAAGNRLTHTDAKGIVSTSTYDALDRLTSTSYTDTTLNVAYHYDDANTVTGCTSSWPVGRLTRLIENSVTTVFCYNSRGKVLQRKQVTASQTDTTTYTYTSADRLSKLSTPDGTVIAYAFNANGLPSSVSVTPSGSTSAATVVSAVTYLPFGPISSYTLGNGQTVTRTYDANYRATDITSPAFNLHLVLDLMGNVSAIGAASGANPATESYGYDPLYRLSALTEANGSTLESYTYNQTGDRTSKTASGLATGAYLYTTGTHQLASIGNAARANDANGNTTGSVIGGSTYGFGYNGRNRLTVAQLNGQTVGMYTYNALGERIGKVATSPQATTERYDYNENGQLIGGYGTTNRDYIWLGDLPVALVDNTINGSVTTSTVNYVTADQLGTPRAVTNSAGTVIWSWAYQGNPFGEQQPTSSAGYALNLRYPGQYYDAESGTNYNMFRTYEPATGRYLQSDPIGLAGGISTYAYANGNPLIYRDPTGRFGAIGFGIGVVAGGVAGYEAGGWEGALTGGLLGGAVGIVAPELSAEVGAGVAEWLGSTTAGQLVAGGTFVALNSGAGVGATVLGNLQSGNCDLFHHWGFGAAVGGLTPLMSGEAFFIAAGGEAALGQAMANGYATASGVAGSVAGAMDPEAQHGFAHNNESSSCECSQ